MKKNWLYCLCIIVLSISAGASFTFAATLHVPANYATIQAGIDAAVDGDTVLVADGTYTGEGNKDIDFGGKAIMLQSENGAESCIIDCEGDGKGFYFANNESESSVLAGFTITNGAVYYGGGGIYCDQSSPSISNCTISGNTTVYNGGGIYCNDASPSITNCTISGNTSDSYGGGIYCSYESSPSITNCTISGNTADDGGGGILCREDSSPSITNCTISGNTAAYYNGGGIFCSYSSLSITNCTISENTADDYGGGIYCSWSSSLSISNTIIYNNTSEYNNTYESIYSVDDNSSLNVTYSDIQDGWKGEGNINADPLFVGDGDYHLTDGSPCIDAGSDDVDDLPETDLDGNPRISGTCVDMGAYEYAEDAPEPGTEIPEGAISSGDICTYIVLTDNSIPFYMPNGSSVEIYGSNGINTVNLETGAHVKCSNFTGSNEINLEESSSYFSVYRSGSTVYFTSTSDTILSIPASLTGQILRFADGSSELSIMDGEVMLGSQVIDHTATWVISPANSSDTSGYIF